MDYETTFPATVDGRGALPSIFSIESWLALVKSELIYEPDTGIFYWRSTNRIAGTYYNGYVRIQLAGHRFGAHQLAWFYTHNTWIMIDHKDGNPSNNKIDNLRPTNYQLNAANRSTQTNNTGAKGVYYRNGKYEAGIKVNQKRIHLGVFSTLEEALDARGKAAIKYFGEYAKEDKRRCPPEVQ